jgi:K+-transporting ATPase ATPase A chain
MVEMFAQMIIPMAMIFALGFYVKKRKLSLDDFWCDDIRLHAVSHSYDHHRTQWKPKLAQMGIDVSSGAMEGKEVRFGTTASAFWSIATTVISTGSVNSMHDSFMPVSGLTQMLSMMTNAFYGGAGAGILNFYIFIILAVFISGLMVGRTPEFMGKKIEAREMKIAMIVALLHPLLILASTALAVAMPQFTAGTLNNPGFPRIQ